MLGLYMCTGTKPFPINSEHRIVWADKSDNLVTLIRTDIKTLKRPKTWPYSDVLKLVKDKKLLLIPTKKVVPQLKLSDKMLAKRYPAKNRKNKSDDPENKPISAPLEYRQRWLPIMEEIKPLLSEVWREKRSLLSLLEPTCEKYGLAVNECYQVLRCV